ncbi:MAG: tyrosine--tRNA ligase [Bacteroidaceae bacterium]|nr:tyrosine--tRNA ligase [Bacteroidaceae bacterium]
MDFLEELTWRGMIHQTMPGTDELLRNECVTAYVGFDPTADSLHIGHLCSIMILRHFQRCGHKPIALVGGATGMIGDPSGKSQERNLLNEETLRHNVDCIKKQLSHFLDFDSDAPNRAELVNNYDWMKDMSFLDFSRDIGKHITVNYMMAKDSVRRRLSGEARDGLSFTEFTYQLLQGYDFLYLNEHKGCKLQMGGADQWGNITTGAELIRRINGAECFALTCPLITKSDGTKFGKTEGGNVWLNPEYTSPYRFYQFWLNVSDDDARRYVKIFTNIGKDECDALILEHEQAPHLRLIQKRLAKDVTVMVHGEAEYKAAEEASGLLFGNSSSEALRQISEDMLLSVFEGVPQYRFSRSVLDGQLKVSDFLTDVCPVFFSKSEARKMMQGGGVMMNKEKLYDHARAITAEDLIDGRYIILQRGKKNYYLLIAE